MLFRKKLLFRIAIASLTALSICSFYFSFLSAKNALKHKEFFSKPKYHFAFYIPEVSESLYHDILEGIKKGCEITDTAISIHKVKLNSSDFSFAPNINVDGIIVYPFFEGINTSKIMDEILDKDMPLVVIDHSVQTYKPYSYIGTNNFDLGCSLGNLLKEELAESKSKKIVIVYSDKSPGIYSEKELLEMGINQVFSKNSNTTILEYKTTQSLLDADEVVSKILRENDNIDAIIFTNTDDTIAAAKIFVDMNLVGSTKIIGYGNTDSITDYVKKGIVLASICINPELMGYKAVLSLNEICKTGHTPAYVDTGFKIITSKDF